MYKRTFIGRNYESLTHEEKLLYNSECIRGNVQFFGWILIVSVAAAGLIAAGSLLYFVG